MTKKKKQKPQELVDFEQPTYTVRLRFPFMWGQRRVEELVLRTAAYCSDLQEMDEAGDNATNEQSVRLIAALTDVDRNGKGIPYPILAKNLRTTDLLRIGPVTGQILSAGEDEVVEDEDGETDEKKDNVAPLRATGGTS